jgi:hypothetical protein
VSKLVHLFKEKFFKYVEPNFIFCDACYIQSSLPLLPLMETKLPELPYRLFSILSTFVCVAAVHPSETINPLTIWHKICALGMCRHL